jgi:hypothetical protein
MSFVTSMSSRLSALREYAEGLVCFLWIQSTGGAQPDLEASALN